MEHKNYSSNLFALRLYCRKNFRFTKVWVQQYNPCDFFASFLIIFSYLLNNRLEHAIQYSAFLIPGLIMMTLQQNAFSNIALVLLRAKLLLIFLMLSL